MRGIWKMFEEHEGTTYLEIRERRPMKLVPFIASVSKNIPKKSGLK